MSEAPQPRNLALLARLTVPEDERIVYILLHFILRHRMLHRGKQQN
jgi:hypothetical protein